MNPRTYLYAFIAITVAFAFFVGGYLLTSPPEAGPSLADNSTSACNAGSCSADSAQTELYTGTVREIEDNSISGATHRLEDNSGKVTAYLKASDDKLELVENMSVEVSGKMLRSVTGGIPLVEVDTVKFK